MPRQLLSSEQREQSRIRRKENEYLRQKGRKRTPAQPSFFSPPHAQEILSTARIDNTYQSRTFHFTFQYEILTDSSGDQAGVSFTEVSEVFDRLLHQLSKSFGLEKEYYRSPLSSSRRPLDGDCPRCGKTPCEYCARLDCSESCEFTPEHITSTKSPLQPGTVQTLFPASSQTLHSLRPDNQIEFPSTIVSSLRAGEFPIFGFGNDTTDTSLPQL